MPRFFFLLLFAVIFCKSPVLAAETPNFVIIFMDDQGYQDLSCYGSPHIKTPNIDSLAADGMKFTSFYSGYCVCSASRATLLTGCYQPRLSMPGVLGPRSNVGLHPDEVTIADLLKTKGYKSMCIGKWHVGDKPETLPKAQGFDHYFGLPYSNDMARISGWGNNTPDLDKIWKEKKWDIYKNDLIQDDKSIQAPVNQMELTRRYTEEAVKFIKANKAGPFLLYMPHTMVHVPLFVTEDLWVEDPKQAYKITMEHVDWSVGEVLKTLKEEGVEDNTLVVFTSDNGPWLSKAHHGGSALPLKNGKATTWEGGMRVPGIFRWPGKIPEGTVTDKVAGTVDLLPTLAAITGADLPTHPIDGHDITALLKDPEAESPHDTHGLFYYKNSKVEALRMGKWKLRISAQGKGPKAKKNYELYDLDADISETTDVAAKNEDVVKEMAAFAEKYDKDLQANKRPIWRAGQ
jgi:arylsulfatase A